MRRTVLALAATFALAAVAPLCAQESVTVPAWKPQFDQKQTWRIEQESARGRSGMPGRWGDMTASLTQHMSVLGATLNGYSVSWEFDPPDESVEGNRYQRAVLAIYGIDRLAIGVDRGGMPLIAYGAQAREERVDSYASGLSRDYADEARLLAQFRTYAAEDALFEVQLFAKPAIMIGRLQRAEAWSARKGERFTLQQTDHLYDNPITGEAAFMVEEIDNGARRVKVSWVWDVPATKLPQDIRNAIAARVGETAGQALALPGPLRGDAGTASFIFRGQAEISLDDGSLLTAQEERTLRIGFETQYLTMKLKRAP